ncbi:hypothetical protein XM25_19510 [Devosia sp. H5989]|nr:hypothetical protein XM25_19510 [Devosia sp. H5989]
MIRPVALWRPMTLADLPAVERMAGLVHPGFFEAPEIFAERRALYPKGTLLLEVDDKPAGYVLSHPWRARQLPALNSLLTALPEDADTYYIHDLALLERARGTGAAGAVVQRLADWARSEAFPTMSLVAVNGSIGFWQRQGFAPVEAPELAGKLASYEEAACFMVRPLP